MGNYSFPIDNAFKMPVFNETSSSTGPKVTIAFPLNSASLLYFR
jgi:hypothetical protein